MTPIACQITFVGMDALDAARLEVRAWLPRLAPLTDQVTAAQVVIEGVDEHRKQRLYRVRMELALPDGMVGVTHDHPSNVAHEDLYVAIRNAFRAARRQLEDYFKTRGLSPEVRREPETVNGPSADEISSTPSQLPTLSAPEFATNLPPSEKRFE